MPIENQVYYMGQPIREMSIEELRDAFEDIARQYMEMLTPQHGRAYGLGMAEMIRRGENPEIPTTVKVDDKVHSCTISVWSRIARALSRRARSPRSRS